MLHSYRFPLAPGTSILIILEDCVVLFFVGLSVFVLYMSSGLHLTVFLFSAVADFFVLKTRYLRTVWECGIIGVLSVLHLGAFC